MGSDSNRFVDQISVPTGYHDEKYLIRAACLWIVDWDQNPACVLLSLIGAVLYKYVTKLEIQRS